MKKVHLVLLTKILKIWSKKVAIPCIQLICKWMEVRMIQMDQLLLGLLFKNLKFKMKNSKKCMWINLMVK